MLRRALGVGSAVAGLVLVPTTASATPEQAPAETDSGNSLYASGQAVLSDGRTLQVASGEVRSAGQEVRGHLYVTTSRQTVCPWGACQTDLASASASAELSDEEVDFPGSLGRASVTDVPLTLGGHAYGPDGFKRFEEQVIISVALTGIGPVSRGAFHQTICGDGSRTCQSFGVEASREAATEVTFGDDTVSGEGSLFRGHSVDAAAPKFDYAGD